MSQAVLDGVRDLLPTLRERADEAERLRVVPEASIKELEETGFFRLLQPKRFDGLESDPVDFYTAVRDIASACGSTGWVSSVIGVHNWQLALFPDQAQQDVWGEDPGTLMSSSYAPTGKATRVSASRPRLTAIFVIPIWNGLLSVRSATKLSIHASSSSAGAQAFTSPHSYASLPLSSLPVSMSSLVLRMPIIRGTR